MKCWYNKWRAARHTAGAHRRYRLLTHIPFKRLHFLTNGGYKVNSIGLCYYRYFKLRLGGRAVYVVRVFNVIAREEEEMKITQEKLKEIIASHGKWMRCEEGGERADLSNAYLRGAYLRGADLSGADLSGADLSGADLSGADLSNAYLRGAYLRGADLSGADLSNAYLRGAYLSGADLSNADLSGADLSNAYLRGAYLSGADLSGADLSNAYLRGAYLRGADLSNAYLRGAYLRGADLSGADLSGADLRGADLSGADLSGADLDKTYYQIVRIGSRVATTTYCVEADNVVCGCWNDYKGGTLDEFRKRVESVYGENGKPPNKKYYTQYIAAIEFFEKMAKLAKKEKDK